MNEINAMMNEKLKVLMVQLQQFKYKHSNAKLGLEMGIDLINVTANNRNIMLLNNINYFAKESSNPIIGTEQAMVSYKKRKDAIETQGREIERCRIEELKSKYESVKIVIDELFIAVIDMEYYVEFVMLYEKKCAELNIDVDDEIIDMINHMESIDINEYKCMVGELIGYLRICEIFTEV
ncbi:hypothetical protein ECANGB1_1355 [Enterospora canceri]|uniref:Uncharacterized protein n=1 Tax=Enterospora canceri TaxID=1081671 RepID=A0A1Y1S3Y6_9MICR|nr:hypothetical protein ECANGB1_1355 [Enterospora canceri]